MCRVLFAFAVLCTASATLTKLATFDGSAPTTQSWQDQNDPVMGGRSTSTFKIDSSNKVGIFNGTCAIVPSLKAPGFCKVTTEHAGPFADVSSHLAGGVELRVRSSTPAFAGFHVAFGAKNVPRSSIFTSGTFKAPFKLQDSTDFQVVQVPFKTFSWDWSSYTGNCDTKDPTGKQHHCCSEDAKYCPTAAFLSTITSLEVWAEGAEGDFHLEIDYVGASDGGAPPSPAGSQCKATEYCCPDAKKCLTPTSTSCKDDATACGSGEVCCPLTKICVKPGADCQSVCADSGTYCCPDAKACLAPTNPGVFCAADTDCGAKSGEVCCPLTKLCVAPGDKCAP